MRHKLIWTGMVAVSTCCIAGLANGQQNNSSSDRSYNQRYDNSSGSSRRDSDEYNSGGRSYGNQGYDNQRYSNQPYNNQQNSNTYNRGNDSQSSNNGFGQQQQDENTAREFIRENDRNGDGVLSRSELPQNMRSNFDSIDRNGDGYLTASELRQHANRMARSGGPPEVMHVWIVGANRGQPSLQELQEAYNMLQKIDQDGDGYITRSELREQQGKVAAHFINHLFSRLDQNSDDEISRSEAQNSQLGDRFDQLDTNHDGYLTRNELKQDIQRDIDGESAISQAPSDRRR